MSVRWHRWCFCQLGLIALVVATVSLVDLGTARAQVPGSFVQQGRLLDTGGEPMTGSVEMTFSIYDAPSGGAVLWQDSVTVEVGEGGFYSTVLGDSDNPIGPQVLQGGGAWLGVAVDNGAEMTPRLRLHSVPYAQLASRAESVADGAVTGDSLAADFEVSGGQVSSLRWGKLVDVPNGLTDGDDDTLGGMSCANGQVAVYDGAKWDCGALMSYDGTDFALSDQDCDPGDVVTGIDASGNVVCSPDADTQYDATQFVPSGQDCGPGQVMQGVDQNGDIICTELCFPEMCDGKDNDCDGQVDETVLGSGQACAAVDCQDVITTNGSAGNGLYWINPDGAGNAFQVECDMSTGSGGWIVLETDRSRNYWNLSYSSSNNTNKCGYDGLSTQTNGNYSFDQFVDTDGCPLVVDITYRSAGTQLTDAQVGEIRAQFSGYHSSSTLFAGDCDSDNWEPSWEVHAIAPDTTQVRLTNFASGNANWRTAEYPDTNALPAKHLLPDKFRLNEERDCGNGGGVIAGWRSSRILLR